jgi:hypothetical protein
VTTKFSQFGAGGIVRTTDIVVGLRGGSNIQFLPSGISDSNGAHILTYSQAIGVGSASNYIDFINAFTASSPTISAKGTDTNVNLILQGQGATGYVQISSTGAMIIPIGTTGQRPGGAAGEFRYNSTTGLLEWYNAVTAAWQSTNTTSLSTQTYVTNTDQTATLPNSQPLSALATGIAYVTTATGIVGSRTLTGTANRLAVTNGTGSAGNPTFDIDTAYVGQTSITTLGTIGTGTWAGTAIGAIHGGTSQTTYILGDILYASTANTLSKLTGNTTSGIQYLSQTGTGAVSAAPVWATISGGDITGTALTKVDDTNVTLTLGGTPTTALLRTASITAGWAGVLSGARGGTGVANTGLTITLGGNILTAGALTLAGAFAATFNFSNTTNVTFPVSGILATTGGASIPSIVQGDLLYGSNTNVLSALAKDTNATRYLSNTGASNNPAWAQIALATGVSGQLPLANGGTNANLTASNGGIFYSTATAGAILAGTTTANQVLLSGSSTAPTWSTATYPAGATANQLLYAASTNAWSGLNSANNGTLVTSNTGVPSISSTLPAAVQGNITTVGALASGSLTTGFTAVAIPQGGTGGTTAAAASANLLIPFSNMHVFTSNGTFTPSANTTVVYVKVWGGGGGGGGGGATPGSGGGGGGYSEGFVAVTPSVGVAVTVGGGGAGGTTGIGGSAGGLASFAGGTTLTGNAGGGGAYGSSPAVGGTGTGGTLNVTGQTGQPGGSSLGGNGGGAWGGNGGGAAYGSVNSGIAAVGFAGGGAGGGGPAGYSGGAGAPGLVLVYY